MVKQNHKTNIAIFSYTIYSGDSRLRKEAEAASELDYNVDVFVLKEKKHQTINCINGVNVYQLSSGKYRGDSAFKYIISYINFFLRLFFKLSWNTWGKKYHIIYCNNMPNFLIFAAIIPKIFRAKIILDILDTMPEVYLSKFHTPFSMFISKMLLFEEKISALFSDIVLTVHEPAKTEILAKHGIPINKIKVIMNLPEETIFDGHKYINSYINDNNIKLMYHGTISFRCGLDIVLGGLKIVISKFPNVILNIYGNGDSVSDIKSLIKQLDLEDNVFFHGFVALDQLPRLISKSDIGIVSYKKSISTDYSLPVKLMEYIFMELPILSVSNRVMDYYFADYELFYYRSDDAESFAKELTKLIENKNLLLESKFKLQDIKKRMNWKDEKIKLKKIFTDLSG